MGIYISDLEIPKDKAVQIVIINDDGICVDEWGNTYGVVSLTPHGDLIDRDALIDDLKWQCKEVFRIDAVSPEDFWIKRNEAYRQRLWQTWCEGFYEYVGSRPTIIPAEEDE